MARAASRLVGDRLMPPMAKLQTEYLEYAEDILGEQAGIADQHQHRDHDQDQPQNRRHQRRDETERVGRNAE